MGYDPPSVKTMAWYNDITYLNEDTIFVNVSSDFAIKGSTGSLRKLTQKILHTLRFSGNHRENNF